MKTWRAALIYLAAVIAFSALSAPWIYHGCLWLGAHSNLFTWLRDVPFHRVFNRLLMLSSFSGGFLLVASQHALSRKTIGLTRSPKSLQHVALGVCVAVLSVAVVVVAGLAVHALSWNESDVATRLGHALISNALVAVIVAVLEETFFRGCLLGWLRQRITPHIALAIVTLFYAITHFLHPTSAISSADEVHWSTGFTMLAQYGVSLVSDTHWLRQFAMLVLIGLSLGWCFLRTSRLYLSMGLHAGWVFGGKMMLFLASPKNAAEHWWFGSGDVIGSPITIVVMAAVFVLMIWLCKLPKIAGEERAA